MRYDGSRFGGTIMMKPLLNWISGIFLAATWVAFALAALVTPSAQAQTYTKTILHDYTGQLDGENPSTRLIVDNAGNLYGVTQAGGIYTNGTVFKIDPSGHYTILYSFGADIRSAVNPTGRLTMDAAGNLYGTASGGFYGVGTVYKLDTNANLTVLYSFNGGQYGGTPEGGLLYVESEGTFFGTTYNGGDLRCNGNGSGCGIVYKLAPNSSGGWTLTVLHTFTGPPDGAFPSGELTRDAQGYLYGTTQQGGASNLGIVFKVRARQESILHSFAGGKDGEDPLSGLLLDSAGNLYGTTFGGGGTKCLRGHANGCGTVYKLDASGTETVLYAFTGGADGAFPDDRLVADPAGNLYGTTAQGGEKPYSGTAYKVDTSGTETVLYNFLGGADGRIPDGLAIDAAGNLYGITELGGLNSCARGQSCGTVFKLTPP
jgi:uncharacterized repeat protein (TIGR03803 family)